jgi:hypothetical protein
MINPVNNREYSVSGAGLGLRRGLTTALSGYPSSIDFMEVAPENWINVGGKMGKDFRRFTERYPFVLHGLSLSIGSPAKLDEELIKSISQFMDQHQIQTYTEHLTYCSDDGHLYDLMPIPFTQEAADYVANRIARVQDILGRQIGMENASYYAAPGKQMEEIDFVNYVVEKADCGLLLDINNIYVNSINHGYNAEQFLAAMPGERIMYAHIAGHYEEAADLIVDTHGADVIDPVWALLDKAYQQFGVFPTLLERDFNFPSVPELLGEVNQIKAAQASAQAVAITA